LIARLRQRLVPRPVETSSRYGLDPEQVESTAFAWLAKRCIEGEPGNLPDVTGAKGLRVLGAIYAR
jgi:anhydro-N-acetylmuramic acid kinase